MKTLVIGASTNPDRYSNKAMLLLKSYGHEVVGLGARKGLVDSIAIETGMPDFKNIDTVTLYLSPANQVSFYDYIVSLRPRRVIFNPGTENPEFNRFLKTNGIKTEEACTLVLLRSNSY